MAQKVKSSNDTSFDPDSPPKTQFLWSYGFTYWDGFWITSIPQKHSISPRRCSVTSEMKREGFMPKVFSFAENIQWHIFKRQEVYMEIGNACLAAAWWKRWRHHGGLLVSENLGKTRATFAVVSFHSMCYATTTCMALLSCIWIANGVMLPASFVVPQLLLGRC